MSVVGERAFTSWSSERLCGFGFLSLSMCFISFPVPFLSDYRLACCHTTSPHHRGALAKPLIQAEPVVVISSCSFPLFPLLPSPSPHELLLLSCFFPRPRNTTRRVCSKPISLFRACLVVIICSLLACNNELGHLHRLHLKVL
jgi:hypothetical protein